MSNPLFFLTKQLAKIKGARTAFKEANVAQKLEQINKELKELTGQKITSLEPQKKFFGLFKNKDAKLADQIRKARQARSVGAAAELKFMQNNPELATILKSGTKQFSSAEAKAGLNAARLKAYQKLGYGKNSHLKRNLALGILGVGTGAGIYGYNKLTDDQKEHYIYPGLAWGKDILHHNTLGWLSRGVQATTGKDYDALDLILDESDLSPQSIEYLKQRASGINPEVGDTINFNTGYDGEPYALEKTIGYGTFGVTKDKNGKKKITVPKGSKHNDSYDWANFGTYQDAAYRDALQQKDGKAKGFWKHLITAITSENNAEKQNSKSRVTDYMQTLGGMFGSRGGTTNHNNKNAPEGYEVIVVSPNYKGETWTDKQGQRHPKRWSPKQENGTTHWKVNIPLD